MRMVREHAREIGRGADVDRRVFRLLPGLDGARGDHVDTRQRLEPGLPQVYAKLVLLAGVAVEANRVDLRLPHRSCISSPVPAPRARRYGEEVVPRDRAASTRRRLRLVAVKRGDETKRADGSLRKETRSPRRLRAVECVLRIVVAPSARNISTKNNDMRQCRSAATLKIHQARRGLPSSPPGSPARLRAGCGRFRPGLTNTSDSRVDYRRADDL